MELGQVHYNQQNHRWERFDGQAWTAIAVESGAAVTEVIIYESSHDDE